MYIANIHDIANYLTARADQSALAGWRKFLVLSGFLTTLVLLFLCARDDCIKYRGKRKSNQWKKITEVCLVIHKLI